MFVLPLHPAPLRPVFRSLPPGPRSSGRAARLSAGKDYTMLQSADQAEAAVQTDLQPFSPGFGPCRAAAGLPVSAEKSQRNLAGGIAGGAFPGV